MSINRVGRKKAREAGFTLIELMIVVAVIGVLAAIAIPEYRDYMARTQASDAVVQLGGLKTPISEFYLNQGYLPSYAQLNDIGAVSGHTTFLVSVTDGPGGPGSGQYEAKFRSDKGVSIQLQGRTITMTYATIERSFVWSCTKLIDAVRPRVCK